MLANSNDSCCILYFSVNCFLFIQDHEYTCISDCRIMPGGLQWELLFLRMGDIGDLVKSQIIKDIK